MLFTTSHRSRDTSDDCSWSVASDSRKHLGPHRVWDGCSTTCRCSKKCSSKPIILEMTILSIETHMMCKGIQCVLAATKPRPAFFTSLSWRHSILLELTTRARGRSGCLLGMFRAAPMTQEQALRGFHAWCAREGEMDPETHVDFHSLKASPQGVRPLVSGLTSNCSALQYATAQNLQEAFISGLAPERAC